MSVIILFRRSAAPTLPVSAPTTDQHQPVGLLVAITRFVAGVTPALDLCADVVWSMEPAHANVTWEEDC